MQSKSAKLDAIVAEQKAERDAELKQIGIKQQEKAVLEGSRQAAVKMEKTRENYYNSVGTMGLQITNKLKAKA